MWHIRELSSKSRSSFTLHLSPKIKVVLHIVMSVCLSVGRLSHSASDRAELFSVISDSFRFTVIVNVYAVM